jgi:hypothetical protein
VISRTFFSFNGDTRTGFNILGFLFGDKVVTSSSGYTTIGGLSLSEMLTRSFEFNVLFQNGFIAFVALVIFIFMMFVHGRNYLAKGEGELSNRMIPVLMLLGGFLYLSLLDDETPMVYTRDFLAATRGSQFYLLFLLAGLVFSPKAAEPVAVAEKTTPAPEAPKAAAPKDEKTLEEVPLNENK